MTSDGSGNKHGGMWQKEEGQDSSREFKVREHFQWPASPVSILPKSASLTQRSRGQGGDG